MSKEKERPEVVDFKTQMENERKLQLGKLSDDDKLPGADITIGELKEKSKREREEFNQKRSERRFNVLQKKTNKSLAEMDDVEFEKAVQTSAVSGVVVHTHNPSVAVPITAQLPELPSDDVLNKMEVVELITLAGTRGVAVKANVDDKLTLIAKLKGEFVEPEKDDLDGLSRAELEEKAKEFGLDGTDKTLFPNIQTLQQGIRAARLNSE